MLTGVIHNPRSHANRRRPAPAHPGALFADPASRDELITALEWFKTRRIELLVIDGGDGTVRDVLTLLPVVFGDEPPLLSIVGSGKTNILAFDLGIRDSWTVAAVLDAAKKDAMRIRTRSPLRISRKGSDDPPLRGFVFGAAALVRAVHLGQDVHRSGFFHNAAVGVTLLAAAAELISGARGGAWVRGEAISVSIDGGPAQAGQRLVTMATTLERLPFALRPFAGARHGLKFLDVDTPPRQLLRGFPEVLWGRNEPWLRAHGYRRGDATSLSVSLESEVVLDGEIYPGGELTVTEDRALRFLTP
jgi:diacylglycerol kinase (ATP)